MSPDFLREKGARVAREAALASNGLLHETLIEALAQRPPHGRCFG